MINDDTHTIAVMVLVMNIMVVYQSVIDGFLKLIMILYCMNL